MRNAILLTICLCLLPLPAEARKRKAKRSVARRAPVVRVCPPPVVVRAADSVQVITQDDEESLQAAIAAWMRAQPEMSEAAQNKAREVAAYWFRRGVESQQGSDNATGLLPGEREQLLRGFSDDALKAELFHRFLTLFTLSELQAEAQRRGLR